MRFEVKTLMRLCCLPAIALLLLGGCTLEMIEPSDRACDEQHGCGPGQSCIEGTCSSFGSINNPDAGLTERDAGSTDAAIPGTVTVTVEPRRIRLTAGSRQALRANVTGATDGAVSWSVLEAEGGEIDQDGLYTAPSAAGLYHVVARSVEQAESSASVEVTVHTATVPAGAFARFQASQLRGDAKALPADGEPVSRWADLTSNDHPLDQPLPGARPVFRAEGLKGQPAVSFDGVDDFLVSSTFASPLRQPTTVLMAFATPPVLGLKSTLLDSAAPSARNRIVIMETGAIQLYAGAWTTPSLPMAGSTPIYLTAVFKGASSVFRVNGTTISLAGSIGDDAMSGLMLAKAVTAVVGPNPDNYSEAIVGELLVYDRELSSSEIAEAEHYLRMQYALP